MDPVCFNSLFPEYFVDLIDHIAVPAKIVITIQSLGIFTEVMRYPSMEIACLVS